MLALFENWTATDFAIAAGPLILLYLARALPAKIDKLNSTLQQLIDQGKTVTEQGQTLARKIDAQTERLKAPLEKLAQQLGCKYQAANTR